MREGRHIKQCLKKGEKSFKEISSEKNQKGIIIIFSDKTETQKTFAPHLYESTFTWGLHGLHNIGSDVGVTLLLLFKLSHSWGFSNDIMEIVVA